MTYISTALELAGAALITYAVWRFSPEIAMGLIGLVLISTGYSLGRPGK